jgi:hypothetical protein
MVEGPSRRGSVLEGLKESNAYDWGWCLNACSTGDILNTMTHVLATRNPDAKVTRPNARRLARLIGLMSRYWVDPDFAADDMEDRRLAISKSYLVNSLGLRMFIEERVKEGLRPVQIHHLPRQDAATVNQAIALLSEHEVKSGVAAALRGLAYQHPFAGGDIPVKPGWTREEARELGIKYNSRTGDGNSLMAACLEIISERWLSVREWDRMMKTTRLPAVIKDLRLAGYDISDEKRSNDSGSKRPYSVYRYFTDPGERENWKREQGDKERQRQKDESDAAARAQAEEKSRRDQKILDGAARRAGRGAMAKTQHSGGSVYGGWVKQAGVAPQAAAAGSPRVGFFRADVPSTPTAPPAHVQGRLQDMQFRVTPKLEVPSEAGVPAEALNKLFPKARTKEVVEFEKGRYVRRFSPVKQGDAIVRWETRWERI